MLLIDTGLFELFKGKIENNWLEYKGQAKDQGGKV